MARKQPLKCQNLYGSRKNSFQDVFTMEPGRWYIENHLHDSFLTGISRTDLHHMLFQADNNSSHTCTQLQFMVSPWIFVLRDHLKMSYLKPSMSRIMYNKTLPSSHGEELSGSFLLDLWAFFDVLRSKVKSGLKISYCFPTVTLMYSKYHWDFIKNVPGTLEF